MYNEADAAETKTFGSILLPILLGMGVDDMMPRFAFLTFILCFTGVGAVKAQEITRPRAREIGIEVGILPTGPLNAITDVKGVKVGHKTVWQGDTVRTGVTVILPHSDNPFREKVPAAIYLGNAFGKLAGSTQV